jgi:hypothetical protein
VLLLLLCLVNGGDSAADCLEISESLEIRQSPRCERHRCLVGGRATPDVDKEPRIRDLNVRRRALAVASAQNATAEDLFIEASRPVNVGDGEKMCDADPLPRGIS